TTTVILARPRIAEHGKDTISLGPDDATAMFGHRAMPDIPELAEQLREMFRLDIPAQRGGPDEVREKHRQSMTFALRFAGLCVHRRGGGSHSQAASTAQVGARPDAARASYTPAGCRLASWSAKVNLARRHSQTTDLPPRPPQNQL